MNLYQRLMIFEMKQRAPIDQRNIGTMMRNVRAQAVRTYKQGLPEVPAAGQSAQKHGEERHEREMQAQARIAKLMAPAQWEAYKERIKRKQTGSPDWSPYKITKWTNPWDRAAQMSPEDREAAHERHIKDQEQIRGRRVYRKHYQRVHGKETPDIFTAKIQGR